MGKHLGNHADVGPAALGPAAADATAAAARDMAWHIAHPDTRGAQRHEADLGRAVRREAGSRGRVERDTYPLTSDVCGCTMDAYIERQWVYGATSRSPSGHPRSPDPQNPVLGTRARVCRRAVDRTTHR